MLAKKRIAEQKRLEKIRRDPDLYETLKTKNRQRYYKRKAEKKIVSVSEMSSRDQKKIRKRNRANSKRYYDRKKQKKKLELNVKQNNPLGSDVEIKSDMALNIKHKQLKETSFRHPSLGLLSNETVDEASSLQNLRWQFGNETPPISPASSDVSIFTSTASSVYKALFKRYKYKKEIINLQKKIVKLKKDKEMYRKKIERLEKNKVSNRYVDVETTIMKKVKSDKKTIQKVNKIKKDVIKFFQEDEVSRICPGKREFITKDKAKHQKRYINDSLKHLYEKFKKEHKYSLHYSTFCKFRPFWVLIPNINNRDTCACKLHSNMEMLIGCLKRNKIIVENDCTDILQSLCCVKDNLTCLQRKCSSCNIKTIQYQDFNDSEHVTYWAWQKKKKNYGNEKTCSITKKVKITTNPKTVIIEFEKSLKFFLLHCASMVNQSLAVKKIKENIGRDECILHIDFSENYNSKYASEIQSMNFGGSRTQITLHTAILYYYNSVSDDRKTQAFCSLSACLRHDAAAVWAHLIPILRHIEENAPQVKTIHIISDSPSSQYRNKTIFYMISKLCWYYDGLINVTWNYTESGHGKGAPDGVGGLLKRTADQLIAYGNDIVDIDGLVGQLQHSTQGVVIEVVDEYAILEKDLLIPKDLKPFPGSMKVHQVVWNLKDQNRLAMRKLTCVNPVCFFNTIVCTHGHHLGYHYVTTESSEKNIQVCTETNEDSKITMERNKSCSERPIILSNIIIKPATPVTTFPENLHVTTTSMLSEMIIQQPNIEKVNAPYLENVTSLNSHSLFKSIDADQPMLNTNLFLMPKVHFAEPNQITNDKKLYDLEPTDERYSITYDVSPCFGQIETGAGDDNLSSTAIDNFDKEHIPMKNFDLLDFEEVIPVSCTMTRSVYEQTDFEDSLIDCNANKGDNEQMDPENPSIDYESDKENLEITMGSWIIVEYKTKKITKHFVGKVTDLKNGEFTITFVKRLNKKSLIFVWPNVADIDIVNASSVKEVLQKPVLNRRNQFVFKYINDCYNIQ